MEEFQDSQDQSNQQNVRDLLAESANVAGESANVVGDSGRLVAAQGRELQGRELQGTTSTARPIDGNAEYPLVLAEIRKHDAAVDDFFARNLVQTVLQFALSNPKFPQAELDALTDVNIARCVKESYRTGPPNHGTGLLLKRVPSIALTWSLEN